MRVTWTGLSPTGLFTETQLFLLPSGSRLETGSCRSPASAATACSSGSQATLCARRLAGPSRGGASPRLSRRGCGPGLPQPRSPNVLAPWLGQASEYEACFRISDPCHIMIIERHNLRHSHTCLPPRSSHRASEGSLRSARRVGGPVHPGSLPLRR